ncbi:MAG: OmpA family protein [Deltaproteobacteria bacterium]|nr:OmpA family protein [Deltaproteobacteria bacterium]
MRRGYQLIGGLRAPGARALALGAALLALCWAPGRAAAQAAGLGPERGLDAQSFKPGLGGDAFLTLSGLAPPLAGRYHLSVGLDLAEGLMAIKIGEEKIGNLVRRQYQLRLAAAYAPSPRVELAAELPLVLYQAHGFDDLRDRVSFTDVEPDTMGIGDLRLLGRVHLMAREGRRWGLAATLELRGLTGETESFFGERGYAISPTIEAELDPTEALRLVVSAGYRFRTEPGRYLNLYQGDELLAAAGVAWSLPLLRSLAPELLGEVLLATPARAPFTFADADALKSPLELFVGLRARPAGAWELRVGLGRGLTLESGFGREALRVMALFSYRADVSPAPMQAECDVDRDGVPDRVDACPRVPGLVQFEGCPDTDEDAIPDFEDECPRTFGTASHKGCVPEGALAIYQAGRIVLLGAIRFDSGRATLRADSNPVLNAVARILHDHPELKHVQVDGHTDSQGNDAFNLDLSRRRAQTIVRYLVEQKVSADRLSSRGFGEERPIADNTTAIGRAKNRRGVFNVLEMDEPEATPDPDDD